MALDKLHGLGFKPQQHLAMRPALGEEWRRGGKGRHRLWGGFEPQQQLTMRPALGSGVWHGRQFAGC